MAADSEKDASEGHGGAQNTGEEDHKPGSSTKLTETAARKRKGTRKLTKAEREKKQESRRNSNARKKQRIQSTEQEVETLRKQCADCKGIQEELGKVVNSVGEVGNKQTAQIDKLCELIIEGLKYSAGRRECWGSTSSNTEVLEEVPNLMASAMRWNGSVMSGSFKPCQSLPEECNQLAYDKLKELYIASEVRHAQEKAALIERHAKEMAATEARHAHHLEMAAVWTEYGQEENEGQALAGASPGLGYGDQFVNYK